MFWRTVIENSFQKHENCSYYQNIIFLYSLFFRTKKFGAKHVPFFRKKKNSKTIKKHRPSLIERIGE